MAEYIEREALLDSLRNQLKRITVWDDYACGIEAAFNIAILKVQKMPAADVVEVRHGRWVERKSLHAEGGVSAKCSVCQRDVQYLGNPLNYCPNCGARMDGTGDV